MPQDLPGFYYDAEKNRYFPIKSRKPGSSSQNKPLSSPLQATKFCPQTRTRSCKLLHLRELNGDAFSIDRRKLSFQEEFHKLHASKPVVWKCDGNTDVLGNNIRYSALEQTRVYIDTQDGQIETEALLAGSIGGSLSLLKVEREQVDIRNRVWPSSKGEAESDGIPPYVWRPAVAPLHMPSRISSIRLFEHKPFPACNHGIKVQCALLTTLGSETSGGCVYILKFMEPLDLTSNVDLLLHQLASFKHTIWTADYNSHTAQAAVGTNKGAALVDVETGTRKWVCHSKSDVLAQQFDQTGNILLCGLRNGAIVTVDVRENQEHRSSRVTKHQIPSLPGRSNQKKWFELRGNISPSHTIYMPSSISSLVSLQSNDQYFLASSMDGSMKLYDHRLTKRGPVQSYEGHVNSHTRIQLGVDQFERFVISGGEDCYVRLWSIKSGKMLFEEKFSDSVATTVCWRRADRSVRMEGENRQNYNCGAWLGTEEGLFHMHWSRGV